MSLYRKKRRRAEVNIIPLVDVLIILIFFFMIAMQFRQLTVLNINPPKIEIAGAKQNTKELVLGVDEDGDYFYKSGTVTREQLQDILKKTATEDPTAPVLIVADEDVALKHMTELMDMCRAAELTKIRLQSR